MSFNEMFSFLVDVVDVNRKGIMIVGIVCSCTWSCCVCLQRGCTCHPVKVSDVLLFSISAPPFSHCVVGSRS